MKREFKQLLLAEKKLLLAIRTGARTDAVSLGAQRYAILKQIEDMKASHLHKMVLPPALVRENQSGRQV